MFHNQGGDTTLSPANGAPDRVGGAATMETNARDPMSLALLKKLVFRMDGAADSAKKRFTSESGTEWEAELSLHSGVNPQSPRLLVMFRTPGDVSTPQRYTQAPVGISKVPDEAVEQLGEDDLRELLAKSVKV